MTRVALLIPLAALVCACTGVPADPAPSQTRASAESAQGPTTITSKTPETTAQPGVVSTPQPLPLIEPPRQPIGPSNARKDFQLIATREGPLDITVWQGQPLLLADGQPISIDGEGRPQADPALGEGLVPRLATYANMFETIAYGGSLAGEAWLTTRQDYERSAADYDVYVRREGRWKRQSIAKGPLVTFHQAYVEREGALLGLLGYASNPARDTFEGDDDSDEARRFRAKLVAAIARAPQGFVHLSGPAPMAMPVLPNGLLPYTAGQTRDGTLYALAMPPDPRDDEARLEQPPPESTLLVWPPDQASATAVALPGVSSGKLFASGDIVVVSGGEDLVLARGTTLEHVSIAGLPDDVIRSAASSPGGDLWLVFGDFAHGGEGEPGNFWFRATSLTSNPTWQKLSLPTPSGTLAAASKRWVWAPENLDGWIEREREALEPAPAAEAVVYARGAAWVVADLGEVWADDMFFVRRVGVFTNRSGAVTPLELEPHDLARVRQLAALGKSLRPGSEKCTHVSVVVGKPADAEAVKAKLAAAEPDTAGIYPGELFVGELAGKRELILTIDVEDAGAVEAGLPKLLEQLGLPDAKADCRLRTLVEMIVDD